MEVKGAILAGIFFVALNSAQASSNEPFPLGYSMGNNGTIWKPNSLSGRQPWAPACFLRDSLRYGLSVCGIDYYDLMDNLDQNYIGQVAFGGWYGAGRFMVKGSYAYFNALNLYNEQQGFYSIGLRIFNRFQASIDMTGFRAGLTTESGIPVTVLYGGVSCMADGKNGAFSLSCNHLPVKQTSRQGVMEPITISAGLYARFDRYGAQGLAAQISHDKDWSVRYSMGEEYCWNNFFSLCAAVAMNPFAFYFGCTVSYGKSASSLSFANHPQLGWSKGLTLDYARP